MPAISNYASKNLSINNKNTDFFDGLGSSFQQSLTLQCEIYFSVNELTSQGKTFARNFITHGYISFYNVLGIRENDVESALFELFIYSRAKAYFNGLFYSSINTQSDLGLCLGGDAIFFHLLRNPNVSGMKDAQMQSFILDRRSEKYKKALILRLVAAFPFLAKFRNYSNDSLGTSPFYIQKYEALLNRLNEDYYSKEHINREVNYEPTKTGDAYRNGQLILVKMGTATGQSVITFNSTPVFNAIQSYDLKRLYYIPVGNGKAVQNNPSFIFTKTYMLRLKKDNLNVDIDKIKRFYFSNKLDNSTSHLVCSEVFTVSGIKCNYASSKGKDFKPITIPTVPIIIQWIESNNKDVLNEIDKFNSDDQYTFDVGNDGGGDNNMGK